MLHLNYFPVARPGIMYAWNLRGDNVAASTPPDFIPPRSSFRLVSEADEAYRHLTDLRSVQSLRCIPVGAVVYLMQAEQDGAFPAGCYRLTVSCK